MFLLLVLGRDAARGKLVACVPLAELRLYPPVSWPMASSAAWEKWRLAVGSGFADGSWEQCGPVGTLNKANRHDAHRTRGMLWFSMSKDEVPTKVDLYLKDGDTTIELMHKRLFLHPWVFPGSLWEDESKLTGPGLYGDHASQANLKFYTLTNCSLTMGFTKHEMGKKNTDVRVAWCDFGGGASRMHQRDNRNLAVNLLLNLCGFQGLVENGPGSAVIKVKRWVPKPQPLARSDCSSSSGHLLPSEALMPPQPSRPTPSPSGHLLGSVSHMPPRPSRPTPSSGDVAPSLPELAEDAPPPLPQVGEG